jgi:hypothetical protein
VENASGPLRPEPRTTPRGDPTHGPTKIVAGTDTGKAGMPTRRFSHLVQEGVAPERGAGHERSAQIAGQRILNTCPIRG